MLKLFPDWRCVAGAAVLLCSGVWPQAAHAQTGQTAQIPLQFDFLNPGARSLGLGSAFIAVADDATAALTNPAGLTQILKSEASLEGRYRSLNTTFLSGGRLSGTVTNTGIDTINGGQYGLSKDTAFRPSFLSLVVPLGHVSIAAHRHELVLQENSFLSNGPFQESRVGNATVNNGRNLGLAGDREIRIDNYGVAAGFKVSDKLSLGADLAIYRFKLTSSFGSLGFKSGIFSDADPATRGQGSTTTQSGSNTQLGVNVGMLVTATPKVRVGAVFRSGAAFDFSQTSVVPSVSNTTQAGRFRTPMVGGVGIRVQPSDAWSLSVDYNRVQYSRLTTDYITLQVDPTVANRVAIPDGNEFHLGGEYTFLRAARTPTIRAGIWYDPKHAVEYSPDGLNSTEDVRLRGVFPGGESLWHYCAGFGVPFSTLFEFNLGADIAKERRYVAASVVVRFHK